MKVIILILVMLPVLLLGKYPFSQIEDVDKIVELSKDTDLLIEGKVVHVNQVYIHKRELRELSINEVTEENLGKVHTYTRLSVEVLEFYKGRDKVKNSIVEVWISGGLVPIGEVKAFVEQSGAAYPFLDRDDVMIMGLKKNPTNKAANKVLSEFQYGYYFVHSKKLQLPSSDQMIEVVEEGELEKSREYIYRQKTKSIKEGRKDKYP